MPDPAADLRRAAAAAREWLNDAAYPFWFDHGIEPQHGGFVDLVEVDGTAVPASPKRTVVQARQIYAFAMAPRFGWSGRWRDAVRTGLDTLERHCRHQAGGYLHSLERDNRPREMHRDLYDQAFIAFAKAHAADALDDAGLVDGARAVFAMLDRAWSLAPAGYWEGEKPDPAVRRQNPHMHLFEAALAIAQTRGATPEDLTRAERLAGWFADHFFDRARGALPELFDRNWQPETVDDRYGVEPGHHFEWAWLLSELAARGGADHGALARALWEFGRRHGIDAARNVAIDEVDSVGHVRSARARLWPQTERLKAALTLGAPADALAAFAGLQPFLATPAPGACFDRMLPDGGFVAEPARATSLYHIVCAYGELDRAARAT
jgi:mannose-6-phosphate isomerase